MSGSVIFTSDARMRQILATAEGIANSRATVLILGESGTGKELLAQYIHGKSSRVREKFMAINCAAVPENLLESELFGYERGAFTGAEQRKLGKLELANGGTFLLDEIGEMPLALQAKLLRVIQEGEIERLGGKGPVPINIRLIAATNRNLADLVKTGQFRQDLFYRLNVIPIEIPPLRQRQKDISLLTRVFVEESCKQNSMPLKNLTAQAEQKLLQWSWPGNIRELQNVIERAVLLSSQTQIEDGDIQIETDRKAQPVNQLSPGMTVSQAEKILILNTLDYTQQNRTHAAQLLGISIRTLRNKINEYKLEVTNE